MFKMQIQDNPEDATTWPLASRTSCQVLKFEDENEARARLSALYPVQVQLEKYSGPKTARVVAILEGTHDSRPMKE